MTGPARTNKARREAEYAKSQREANKSHAGLNRTQIEAALREAQRQFTSTGHTNPKHDSLGFDAWLRAVAQHQPTLQEDARFLIALQDCHEAITDARDDSQRIVNRQKTLLAIASKHLDVHTFERQRSGADFQEQAVWTIQAALEAAYEAGRASK